MKEFEKPCERRYHFKGDKVNGNSREYTINEQLLYTMTSGSVFLRRITIEQNLWNCDPDTKLSRKDSITIEADKLRRFIAELQDIAEFMEDHGMLSKEEEDGGDQ